MINNFAPHFNNANTSIPDHNKRSYVANLITCTSAGNAIHYRCLHVGQIILYIISVYYFFAPKSMSRAVPWRSSPAGHCQTTPPRQATAFTEEGCRS